MKKSFMAVCLLANFLLRCSTSFAQKDPDPVLYDKYNNQKYSAYDYVQIAEKVGWKPVNANISLAKFEDAFLEVAKQDGVLKSFAMQGCYYCALNREYLYERYNRTYKAVTQDTWNEYCPVLYTLMGADKK